MFPANEAHERAVLRIDQSLYFPALCPGTVYKLQTCVISNKGLSRSYLLQMEVVLQGGKREAPVTMESQETHQQASLEKSAKGK